MKKKKKEKETETGINLLRLLASSSQKSWPFLERGSSLSAKLHGEWEWEGTPAGDGKHFPYKLGLDGILLKTPPPLFVFFRRPNPGKEPTLFHGGPMPQPGPTTLSLSLHSQSLLIIENGNLTVFASLFSLASAEADFQSKNEEYIGTFPLFHPLLS